MKSDINYLKKKSLENNSINELINDFIFYITYNFSDIIKSYIINSKNEEEILYKNLILEEIELLRKNLYYTNLYINSLSRNKSIIYIKKSIELLKNLKNNLKFIKMEENSNYIKIKKITIYYILYYNELKK